MCLATTSTVTMSDMEKRLHLSKLPPMPPPGVCGRPSAGNGSKRGPNRGKRDFSAVSWDKYFERRRTVKIDDHNLFSVYESGTVGPACVFLHGGGYSGLSWAPLARILADLVTCRCVAIDLRGHGDTVTDSEDDLSADTLSTDVGQIVERLYGEEAPPIILIGHSMGGAIGVHVAYRGLIPTLVGLAVIDVVEGTALEALSSMQSFLRGRPRTFKSLEHAIEWSLRSGQTRNLDSAKVSMAGQVRLVRLTGNETALPSGQGSSDDRLQGEASNLSSHHSSMDAIMEDCEQREAAQAMEEPSAADRGQLKSPADRAKKNLEEFTWRIDLSKTDVFWRGWFQGLSQHFLACPVTKLLLLAGVDRLDKDLTVGQMQGKFQMQVLPQCGHAVHEDVPERVAEVLATFMVRHKFAEPAADFHRTFPAY